MTRKSDFTQDIADIICQRLAEGESLRGICKDDDMPDASTVTRWLAHPDHESFRIQYAHARELQADKMAEDILAIADNGENDTYVDEDGNARTDHDVIARSRLRVDARKWLASKMAPKKYGEKVDINHGGQPNNPITGISITVTKPE